jgi:hypothetical protein
MKKAEYIVLKQVNIDSINDLQDFEYFIVHAISEFRIYKRKEFLKKYTNFDKIINLYCIKPNEELRYNNRNWVKINETHEAGQENVFKVLDKEEKDFIAIKDNSSDIFPIMVYKYFLEHKSKTLESGGEGIFYLNEIPIIYRHIIRGNNGEK